MLPAASSGIAAALRRTIARLDEAAAALRQSRDSLARHHDALGDVRDALLSQVGHARGIGVLADAVGHAVAAGDLPALQALQAEIRRLLDDGAARRDGLVRTDAAD